jgi:hypothetical protein
VKFYGRWSKTGGWPELYAQVRCKHPFFRGYIEFAIDTGSPFTILSQFDADKLSINFKRLSKASGPVIIASFHDYPYVLKDVAVTPYQSGHTEVLEEVFVIPPPKELGKVIHMPSILGRDFLNRFNIVITRDQGQIVFTDEPLAHLSQS